MTIRIRRTWLIQAAIVLFIALAVLGVALFFSARAGQAAEACGPGYEWVCVPCGDEKVCCDCVPIGSNPEPHPATVCANQPYEYNTMGGHWARRLWLFCYAPTTDDGQRIVWDVLGSGCTWAEFQDHLASLGISTDYETSVKELISAGYWTEWGARGPVEFPKPACYSLAEPV